MHFVRKYLLRLLLLLPLVLLLLLLLSLLIIIIIFQWYPGCLLTRRGHSQTRKEDYGLLIFICPAHTIDARQDKIPICKLVNYTRQPWNKHPVLVPYCWTVYNTTVRFSHNRSEPFWHGFVYFIICPTICMIFGLGFFWVFFIVSIDSRIPLDIIIININILLLLFYFIVGTLNYTNIMSRIDYLLQVHTKKRAK